MMSNSLEEVFQKALVLHQKGEMEEAQALYKTVLAQEPNHVGAMHFLGVTLSQIGEYEQGLKWIDRALAISPNNANIWNNRARTLLECKMPEAALSSAKNALLINPEHIESWYNSGCIYKHLKQYEEAIRSLNRAIELNPNHSGALKCRGTCLYELGRSPEALADCKRAFVLASKDEELPQLNATLCCKLGYLNKAIEYCKIALQIKPYDGDTLSIYVHCLRTLGDIRKAIEVLKKIQYFHPEMPWILGELIHTSCMLCDWEELRSLDDVVVQIKNGKNLVRPFVSFALFDDPKLLLEIAKLFSNSTLSTPASDLPANPRRRKIRIGYFSADFRLHPMSMLITEVIESHNRESFEIYLFSLIYAPDDEYRQRLRLACDHFVNVDQMDDATATRKSRELGIDIAIDLMGFTAYNRHSIFTKRCAPVQVSWIGMPGTSGSPAIDYIIADPVVIPEESRKCYSEQVVHIPSFWPNDSTRLISAQTPTREGMGLPQDAFVFCCFNACFKVLPETFSGWMRIMAATPNSVLWLSGINLESTANLREAAKRVGIDINRLIFSTRLPAIEDHLARHRLADLFLDTFPYNAHTTAADALWAGLPVLTRSGQSFASRVAASLLNRIGLPELITDNQADFEARAIYLANEGRSELKAIREKLAILRKNSPLFDGKAFAKDLEKAYQAMYERSQAGFKPDFISLV